MPNVTPVYSLLSDAPILFLYKYLGPVFLFERKELEFQNTIRVSFNALLKIKKPIYSLVELHWVWWS